MRRLYFAPDMYEKTLTSPAAEDAIKGKRSLKKEFLIVGIGASAGGIQALQEFFKEVPEDSGMAYVVILHLSPDFDSQLAAVLQRNARIPVAQVTEKIKIKPNHVYVVPPNRHLTMSDGSIVVSSNISIDDRRSPVDIFFRTLANEHGPNAIAVILSGTGANGSLGIVRIKEKGGSCFVQNPEEAEFNDMPRNSIATELVDEVLDVADIPAKIIAYKKSVGTVQITDETDKRPEDQQQALHKIFTQIRLLTGHDFINYKRPTLLRRIERRINVKGFEALADYANYILEDNSETIALLKDLLISVTNFFRDKKAFAFIDAEILPILIKQKKENEQLRIWIPGCATGEEAYSIAMLCAEHLSGIADAPRVQIFATDIDESSITQAREGLYSASDAADISEERLRRFFTKEGNHYRIRREVRETIMFATHNFLKDPPFSHVDLISCRNVMIYLNATAQERIFKTFHFALNAGSYLFLGNAETADGATDLFVTYSHENHIFQSRQVSQRSYLIPESTPSLRFDNYKLQQYTPQPENVISERISFADLHQQLLEQYASPSLVINEDFEIVHLTEKAGKYLQISGGEISQNLLKLVRPELRLELRSALYQALERQSAVEVRSLKVLAGDKTETINIHIKPVLREGDVAKGFILIVFEPADNANNDVATHSLLIASDKPVALHLEEELIRLKGQLQSSNKQHEFQSEELKATNEELQAMNEELRSAAEELETSKEELQSINEELRTVNQELKVKIDEANISTNNLQNLINSTNIGSIFLDRSLRVILFTPATKDIFNLIPTDYGRPLSDITSTLDYDTLLQDAAIVLEKLSIIEKEVHTKSGTFYLMRILPYRTNEDRIKGVVLTFIDLTERKAVEAALQAVNERMRLIVESAKDYAIFSFDTDHRINSWNIAAWKIFGYTEAEIMGKQSDMLFVKEDREAGIPLQETQNAQLYGRAENERWHKRKDGSRFYGSGVIAPLCNDSGETIGFVKIMRDLTEQKNAEETLRVFEERNRIALQSAEMAAWDWNIKEDKIVWNEQHYLLFGLKPENTEHESSFLMQFIYPADKAGIITALKEAVEGTGIYKKEFRITRADNNELRWMSGFGRAINWDEKKAVRMVGVMFDITERKNLEQQKEDFISIASHELRTPVTSIKAYAEVLHDMFIESGDEEGAGLLKKLDVQVDHLIDLIRALLDTSKLAEGELTFSFETFDLNILVKKVTEDLQRLSTEHQIIIANPTAIIIKADRERIGQVITNLISNAIKYSPKGGDVVINWERKENKLQVSVSDKGIGISAEVQQKIFDRFFRVETDQTKNFPGMGLGLYVTAYIIHKHGGEIWVNSKPGEGSTFNFTLPLNS